MAYLIPNRMACRLFFKSHHLVLRRDLISRAIARWQAETIPLCHAARAEFPKVFPQNATASQVFTAARRHFNTDSQKTHKMGKRLNGLSCKEYKSIFLSEFQGRRFIFIDERWAHVCSAHAHLTLYFLNGPSSPHLRVFAIWSGHWSQEWFVTMSLKPSQARLNQCYRK
jgi:hypothetical protein